MADLKAIGGETRLGLLFQSAEFLREMAFSVAGAHAFHLFTLHAEFAFDVSLPNGELQEVERGSVQYRGENRASSGAVKRMTRQDYGSKAIGDDQDSVR